MSNAGEHDGDGGGGGNEGVSRVDAVGSSNGRCIIFLPLFLEDIGRLVAGRVQIPEGAES